MRHNLHKISVALMAAACSALLVTALRGAEPTMDPYRRSAAVRRSVEMARLRLELYERVEYPLRLRRLESEIKLTEADVASQKRRLVEYEQFEKFKDSGPLFLSLEETRLMLTTAQTRLADLQEEKLLLKRYHADELRLLKLELEAAQDQLNAIGR